MAPKNTGKADISERTGRAKIVRAKMSQKEAKALKTATTMTKEEWRTFQSEKYKKAWPKPDYMEGKQELVFVRDGGEGAYRDQTYEIVTRWRADTRISYRPHAKAPGSKSHVRYEKYAKARTVAEALKLGSYPLDWCFDYEHGFIKVQGPVRDEPIDMSKVENPKKDLTEVDTVICKWFRRELAKRYNLKVADLLVEKGCGESVIMRAHRLVADRSAAEYLTKARREGRPVRDDEVEHTLRTWAFAKNSARVNVMPEGQDFVWSDTVGLLRDRMGDIHLTQSTKRYPSFVRIICQWLNDRLPSEVSNFKYTSLNLNCNYAAKRHRDNNNFGPSMIKAFGPFSGGELNVFPEDDKSKDLKALPEKGKVQVDIKEKLVMFNGNSAHEVEAFKDGNRFSVVYFTIGCHAKAKDEDKSKLADLGFLVPAVDEDPLALLGKPQGYSKAGAAAGSGSVATPVRGTSKVPKLRIWSSGALAKGGRSKVTKSKKLLVIKKPAAAKTR